MAWKEDLNEFMQEHCEAGLGNCITKTCRFWTRDDCHHPEHPANKEETAKTDGK